jgi:4-hydroxybenzoate polyprenyltransferase
MLIDVFALAALYTTRIVAGGAAGEIPLSDWLIMFSVMIFLSLAMVKRYAELDAMQRDGKTSAAGRGYLTEDMSIVRSFGTAAGYVAVLVLALYMNSTDVRVLYRHPHALWILFGLLLYWISRVWMFAFRGQMHDDPIVFAIKNRLSLFVIALCVVTVLAAT